jgi:hypothetical protein
MDRKKPTDIPAPEEAWEAHQEIMPESSLGSLSITPSPGTRAEKWRDPVCLAFHTTTSLPDCSVVNLEF